MNNLLIYWILKVQDLLSLTEINDEDFEILNSYFKQGYTIEQAADKYREFRSIK